MTKFLLLTTLLLSTACYGSSPPTPNGVNEFGLVQLTKYQHPNIYNNDETEDVYSYTNREGKIMPLKAYGDDWASPKTADLFLKAVNAFLTKGAHSHIKIIINDVSAYNPKKNLGHKTHFNGKAIDIRFLTADGQASNNIHLLNAEDININSLFVAELRAKGFDKIYSHQGIIPGSKHVPNHHNHLHIAR